MFEIKKYKIFINYSIQLCVYVSPSLLNVQPFVVVIINTNENTKRRANSLVAELALPHTKSVWGCLGKKGFELQD